MRRLLSTILAFAFTASAFAADVHVDVVRVNWWGTGTTTDPTHVFVPTAGRKPKAVILVTSGAVGRDADGTNGDISIGFSDGTNTITTAMVAEDGVAAASAGARRGLLETRTGMIFGPDTGLSQARVVIDSFTDGGFILRQDKAGSPFNHRYHATCIVFSGSDVQAAVGMHTLDNTTAFDAENITTGFQPNMGFVISGRVGNNDSSTTSAIYSFGAFNDEGGGTITNRAVEVEVVNNANPTSTGARYSDALVACDAAAGYGVEVTAVAATTFSVLQSGAVLTGSNSPTIGYLALNVGDLDRHLATKATPIAIGNESDTAPGFKPQAVVLGTSLVTTANTATTSGAAAEHLGVAAYTAREQMATSVSTGDNLATGSAKSFYGTHCVSSYNGAGTEVLEADLVSFDSTGDTLNWTIADPTESTARLFWKFTLGEAETEHTPTRLAGVLDVTNPPGNISPAGPFICDEELQAIFQYAVDRNLSRLRSGGMEVYFPGGIYYLDNDDPDHLTTPLAIGGFSMRGAGFLTEENLNSGFNDYQASVMYWVGDATGPMFEIRNVDGFTCSNMTFHGGDNAPNGSSGTAADAIDILTHVERVGTTTLPTHYGLFDRCSWLRGEVLVRFPHATGTANVAEWTWRDCHFKGNHSDADPSVNPEYGVFIDHTFGQNFYFYSCWWREMNVCIAQHSAGALATYGGSMADCHQYLELGIQNESSSGAMIHALHQDGEATGAEGQGLLYSSTTENVVKLRNITFSGIVWPDSLGPSAGHGGDTNEEGNRRVTSYTGNTLVLSGNLNVRVGDRIGFWTATGHVNGEPRLAETTVTAKALEFPAQSSTYTVADTAVALGVDDELSGGTLRASYGEPIFFLFDREHLTIENTWLLDSRIKGRRLVEAIDGLPTFAGNPFIALRGCTFSDPTPANTGVVNRWIWQNGVNVFYDINGCRMGYEQPMPRITNVTPYIAELAAPPTASNNVAAGYPVGAYVKTTTPPNRVYFHVSDGVWVDITRRVPAPF